MRTSIFWHNRGTGSPPPRLLGDFSNWEPLTGLPENEKTRWDIDLQKDARVEYCFLTPDDKLIADPGNPFQVHNGLGPMSELVMPEYHYHPVFEPYRRGRKGDLATLRKMHMDSLCLGYQKQMAVYQTDAETGVLLVFNDGYDYVEFAQAVPVLDFLRARKLIPPCTAVFVNPPNRHGNGDPDRTTEYGLNPSYSAFLAEEVAPRFPDRSGAVVIGASYGGLCAIYTAMRHADVFGAAYSQSGYVGFRDDEVIKLLGEAKVRFFLMSDIGLLERKVGAGFLNPAELDFLEANRRMHKILAEQKWPLVCGEFPEGHTWGFWRGTLVQRLPELISRRLT